MKLIMVKAEETISLCTMVCGLVLLFVLLMVGCSNSRITQENYGKIEVGMKYSEVVAILGEPTNCSSVFSATNCIWGNATRSIDVSLIADQVVFLSSKGL